MAGSQTYTLTTTASFVGAGDVAQMTVKNVGPSAVYYSGSRSVSSTSNSGSIAAGASATIAAGQWFVTASGLSRVAVTPITASSPILPGDPFRFDGTRLGTFKSALANAASSPVNVLNIGDSITEGDHVTAATRWQNLLTTSLRAAYPSGATGGEGYVPAYYVASTVSNRVSFTGTVTNTATGSLGGRLNQMSNTATATLAFTGTAIDVIYFRGSTTGTFTWAIDGGSTTSVDTNLAQSTSSQKTSITGLSAGAHTIVITATTSNKTFLDGFMVYNGDESKGVRQWDAGHAGWTTADFIAADSSTSGYAYGSYANAAPSLVNIALGVNDYGTSLASRISPRAYGANLRDLIAGIRAAAVQVGIAQPSIILWEQHKRGILTAQGLRGPWDQYIQEARNVAQDDGSITLFDSQAVLGDAATNVNGYFDVDLVHPVASGHTALTAGLMSLIASA